MNDVSAAGVTYPRTKSIPFLYFVYFSIFLLFYLYLALVMC